MTRLPGLGTWSRVTQYRQTQIDKLKNVQFIPSTRLTAADVLDYGAEIVIVATGADWARDGMNGATHAAIDGADASLPHVCTPEQIVLEGKAAGERVVVVDNDGYHMGATMAELLAGRGAAVTLITHFDSMGPYLRYTLEEQRQYQRLVELGVRIVTQTFVTAVTPAQASTLHLWSGEEGTVECDTVVLVTQRGSAQRALRGAAGATRTRSRRGHRRRAPDRGRLAARAWWRRPRSPGTGWPARSTATIRRRRCRSSASGACSTPPSRTTPSGRATLAHGLDVAAG